MVGKLPLKLFLVKLILEKLQNYIESISDS